MPNSKTHDIISLISIPIIGFFILLMPITAENFSYVFMSYIFSCFMFNGDLDIHSKPYNRWLFLKFYWLPYQRYFNHRSKWTHGIILGTVVRLIYCLPIVIPFIIYFDIDVFNVTTLYVLLGLELGNSIHTISDYIF